MLKKGRYQVRQARSQADLRAAQALRALCFGQTAPLDADAFDAQAQHMLVEEQVSGTLVCCFRLMTLKGAELARSYAAQFYDLSALTKYDGLMMELGRFCVHPGLRDPDILRLAWAAMTDQVDRHEVQLLFGCSSFEGIDANCYLDAFALLQGQHLAPCVWQPGEKAVEIYRFAQGTVGVMDHKAALVSLPPLLRTYLMMGGWVSDHAVIDRQMNTLHVFTGLEIAAIPEPRKRLLRALI